jgi:DNA-binding transcriptional regulator YiaG
MVRFEYNGHLLYIHDKLAKVIQIFAKKRKLNNDNLLIISGNTGTGKSNLASLCCAYYSYLTGIKYNNGRVFFKSPDFIEDAITSYDKIFHYDESLFSAMAQDWQSKEQKELIKMLLLCRKKRHFYVFCIPDFFKLKDTIKEEKCDGLIWTRLFKNRPGFFEYYRKKKRDAMISYYQRNKQKAWFKFRSFKGTFAKNLPRILDEKKYDKDKDKAIASLLDKKKSKKLIETESKLLNLQKQIAELPSKINMTQKDFAKIIGTTPKTLIEWKKKKKN